MPTFKDNKEREWDVAIDAPKIDKIREECDPNFLLHDSEKENTYERLLNDPVLLCRVIYILCTKQREERGVTEEDFYMEVIGDAIDRATQSMLKAIVSFTPRRTRAVLEVFATHDNLRQEAIEKAVSKISDPKLAEEIMKNLQSKVDSDFQQLLTQLSSATSSPDS